ncbi:MAG TPA: DUF4157 domain-containing protein [Chloroflexota bacterium]|nr:DUF4157 domain-containing protein [Chloroflexota bacterium]HUM70965.1 DUF4157 domain-containing protein [Chloroflexota bacterium]
MHHASRITFFTWWRERAVSLWLWPFNLARDFSVRVQRIGHTCRTAVTHKPPLAKTIHLLAVQIFDLFGGPELAQVFLRLLAHTTPLTTAETAVITDTVGIRLRFTDVRLAEGGLSKWIFRFNGNLAFTAWHTIFLPQTPARSRQNLALLVHELTHVYQYEQVGSRYMTEAIYMLIATRRDCYAYGGAGGLQQAYENQMLLSSFNREQQAQIVQDYFSLHVAGEGVTAYLPYINELRHGRL